MADTSEQVPTPSGGGDPPAQTPSDAGGGVAGAGRRDLAPGESLAGAVTFTVELDAG